MDSFSISKNKVNMIENNYDNNNSNLNIYKNNNAAKYAVQEYILTKMSGDLVKEALPNVYDNFRYGYYHLNDLSHLYFNPHNCSNLDLRDVIKNGLETPNGVVSNSPKKLSSLLGLALEAMIGISSEQSGGVGLAAFNWFLAPFVRGLSYDDVYQEIQSFIFRLNDISTSRGSQPIFSSLNIDVRCPSFLEDEYGDYVKESNLVIECLVKLLIRGDGEGKLFLFPNPVFNLDNTTDEDFEFLDKIGLFDLSIKFSTPYFTKSIQSEYKQVMGCFQENERLVIQNKDDEIISLTYKELFDKYSDSLIEGTTNKYTLKEPLKTYTINLDNYEPILEDIQYLTSNGKAEIVELKIAGRTIKVTKDHKFPKVSSRNLSLTGGECSYNDGLINVAKSIGFNKNGFKFEYEPDYILEGFYLGDGAKSEKYLNGNNRFAVYKEDKVDYILTLLDDLSLDYNISRNFRVKDKKFEYRINYHKNRLEINDLYNLNDNQLFNVLCGLISSDGYVGVTKSGFNSLLHLQFVNTNKELIEFFTYICFRLGLDYAKTEHNDDLKENQNVYWRIYLRTNENSNNVFQQMFLRDSQKDVLIKGNRDYKGVKSFSVTSSVKSKELGEFETYCLGVNGFVYSGDFVLSHQCRTALPNSFTGDSNQDSMRAGNSVYSCLNLPLIAIENPDFNDFKTNVSLFIDELMDYSIFRFNRTKNLIENDKFCFIPQFIDINNCSIVIGMLGLNECVQALTGSELDTDIGFSKGNEILDFMTDKLNELRDKHRDLRLALFSNPSENTCYKLANKSIKHHGFIKSLAKGKTSSAYYTNGVNHRVDSEIDLYERIDNESDLGNYTAGGNIVAINIGEQLVSANAIKYLTKKISELNKTGFWAYTTEYSFCHECSAQLVGEHYNCVLCDSDDITVYSRVVGYYQVKRLRTGNYRWNPGKTEESFNRFKY